MTETLTRETLCARAHQAKMPANLASCTKQLWASGDVNPVIQTTLFRVVGESRFTTVVKLDAAFEALMGHLAQRVM